METINVEYAIIGAGTAGLGAYSKISRKTDSLVMIQDGPYGTTCARVGCMPSKLLITAADHAHEIKHSEFFGVRGEASVDGRKVLERLRRERDQRFVGRNLSYVAKIPAHQKLEGRARFIAPGRLLVDDRIEVNAQKIIIACGSRPVVSEVYEPVRSRVLTSDTIFELEDLPESVAVIGLGVIALELGQALHRLGVKTTLFGRSGNIGGLTHPKMQRETLEVLSRELEIYPAGQIEKTWEDRGAWIEYRTAAGDTLTRRFDRILVATGRTVNIDRLNLEATGISPTALGAFPLDRKTLAYGNQPIFIAGDASDNLAVWHEAFDEGRIAADNALNYPHMTEPKRRTPLLIYFTDPQMAIVGQTYRELQHRPVIVGELAFDSPRHIVWNKVDGRIQVYLEPATGEILGAELLGYQAEHLAHLLALAITHRLSAEQLLEMPIYHPSAEELLRDVVQSAERTRLAKLAQTAARSQVSISAAAFSETTATA